MDKFDVAALDLGSHVVVLQVNVLCSLVVNRVLAPMDATRVVLVDHDRPMAFHLLFCGSLAAAEDPKILVPELFEQSGCPHN